MVDNMQHRNYEIYIKSDEHALEEYDVKVDEEDDRIINCWIPSTVGKVSDAYLSC